SQLAAEINQNLAVAAEAKGWTIGLGSTRALLESDAHQESFLIRKQAPTAPLFANIGPVQFNYGDGAEQCQRNVDMTGADSIVLHVNILQAVVQDGGDLNFTDLLPKLEAVCINIDVRVAVKEGRFGIDG